MAVNHKLIRELTGESESEKDITLRGNAMRRALGDKPPRTLTPFEWQQWYAEHGVPSEHRQGVAGPTADGWWSRLKHYMTGGGG